MTTPNSDQPTPEDCGEDADCGNFYCAHHGDYGGLEDEEEDD